MRMVRTGLIFAATVAGVMLVCSGNAQARPSFVGEFKSQYEKLAPEVDKAKCMVCHYGDSKKNRNDYGTAMGKALGAPNVKDAAKIKEALKKIEGEKSGTEGKTFGDLIKDGKLPGKEVK